MPEVENAEHGITIVRQELRSGFNGIKVYAQTWWDPNLKMPPEVVKAVTSEAHRHGKLVFVHPSGSYGLQAAIESGADVLTHTTPQTGSWNKALLARMKQSSPVVDSNFEVVEGRAGKRRRTSGCCSEVSGYCRKPTAGLLSGWRTNPFRN